MRTFVTLRRCRNRPSWPGMLSSPPGNQDLLSRCVRKLCFGSPIPDWYSHLGC